MQPSYYSILPAPVRYSKALTYFQKILFSEITALSNQNGYCSAGNEYFAQLYECDPATISRAISKIQKGGFIQVEILQSEGNKRKIYPSEQADLLTKKSIPIDEKVNRGIDKNVMTPIDKKVMYNNTRDNNTSINTNIDKSILEKPPKSSLEILKDAYTLTALKTQFGPGVEIEVDKAVDWLLAKGKRYKDYVAFMRNWMRNSHKFDKQAGSAPSPGIDYKAREAAQNHKPAYAAAANNMHLI